MRTRDGFSLLEVIIAVILLGIVAAVAIPRFSTAAEAPDQRSVLRSDLQLLRIAIERFYQDHGFYPAQRGDGVHPPNSPEAFRAQLTRHTDASGHVADTPDEVFGYGPYLRDGIPPCPLRFDDHAAEVFIAETNAPPSLSPDGPAPGWIYESSTGRIWPNSDTVDPTGRPYHSY